MNKLFKILLVWAFIFAASIPSFAQTATDLNGIKITGYASVALFGTHSARWYNKTELNPNWIPARGIPWSDAHYEAVDRTQGEYTMWVGLGKTFEATNGTLFIKLTGGQVGGGASALGVFRGNVDDDVNDASDNVVLKEAWYSQPFQDGALNVKVGFMDDGTGSPNAVAASVGSFFTGDATVVGPDTAVGAITSKKPFGIALSYSPMDLITVSFSHLLQSTKDNEQPNRIFGDGSNAFDQIILTVKPVENGNYRIGYWKSFKGVQSTQIVEPSASDKIRSENRAYAFKGDGDTFPQGVFVSVDQQVIENVSLFARAGYLLNDAQTGKAGTDWQFGFVLKGNMWNRANDSFFAGIGQAYYPINYGRATYQVTHPDQDRDPNENTRSTRWWLNPEINNIRPETHFEANYKLGLVSGVTLITFAQYVQDIMEPTATEGTAGDNNNYPIKYHYSDGYAGGVRLVFAF
jgi:hypothetical protein